MAEGGLRCPSSRRTEITVKQLKGRERVSAPVGYNNVFIVVSHIYHSEHIPLRLSAVRSLGEKERKGSDQIKVKSSHFPVGKTN